MKHINEYLINKGTKNINHINAVDDLDFDYALIWDDTVEFHNKQYLKDELKQLSKSEDPDSEDLAMVYEDLLSIKDTYIWHELSGPVFTGGVIKGPLGMKLR